MSRGILLGVALVAILLGILGGYCAGAGLWPFVKLSAPDGAITAQAPTGERKVLYWKHPGNDADFSPAPKKTADGQDYVAVYDEDEPAMAGAQSKAPPTPGKGKGKILYYRNPMGLADTSPVPKKDWMGMDYIPVYEGEEQEAGTVKVSLDKVQRSGVRSEPIGMQSLARPVRAPGIAKPDERTLLTIALRADSFIERLYVNETGRHVQAGEPLFRIYSPDMVKVQVDYRVATGVSGSREDKGALQRLRNLQIPPAVLDELQRTREPVMAFDWPAPVTGVVMQKKAVEGMMMRAGEEMLRIADLSNIWVIADVPEQDIGRVRIGAPAKLSVLAFPGEAFAGRVSFILHELDATTRTAKVRIEVANPEHRIKHEMFAETVIDTAAGDAPRLAIPASAVIDSGNRQIVLVDKGEGRFEPRPVRLGMRGDGFIEALDGVSEGDKVVVAANFLIDAESNLKAALTAFTAEPAKPEAKP